MSRLGLLPIDIKKKLNPLDTPHGVLGVNSIIDENDVAEVILEQEEAVLSRLPARYLTLISKIDGVRIVRSAVGGETKLFLGLTNVREDVFVYINFTDQWERRKPSRALSRGKGFSLNTTEGSITLDAPLKPNDSVIAEYSHCALKKCHLLRSIVKDLAVAEIARRLYPDDERFERYSEWEKQAYSNLARLRKKDGERIGIEMFDKLDLINETRSPVMVPRNGFSGGGMM